MEADALAAHVAAVCNAAWWVRWYARPHQAEQRAAAIRTLGLAARAAFNASEDFGPLLYAIARTLPAEEN